MSCLEPISPADYSMDPWPPGRNQRRQPFLPGDRGREGREQTGLRRECSFRDHLLYAVCLGPMFPRSPPPPTTRGICPLPLLVEEGGTTHGQWELREKLRANGRLEEADFSRRGFLKWPTCSLEVAGEQGTPPWQSLQTHLSNGRCGGVMAGCTR